MVCVPSVPPVFEAKGTGIDVTNLPVGDGTHCSGTGGTQCGRILSSIIRETSNTFIAKQRPHEQKIHFV